jgi:hypothetical protein
MHTLSRRRRVVAAVAVVTAAGAGTAFAGHVFDPVGPSSSQTPYVVPTHDGVRTKALLTVGDSVNAKPDGTPYRMVGIPDGLGAFDNDDGTFTLLMNHELGTTAGIPRAHGARGAFVSRWVIDKKTLKVLHGADLVEDVFLWNGTAFAEPATPVTFNRFCSADLPVQSALYDKKSKRGTKERLFLNGEEAGAEGRAFAHAMDGTTYELPWLGKMSWENSVANPATGEDTIVACTDDDAAGQIYVYAGVKQKTGATPVEQAGLTNGTLFGVKVAGFPFEDAATGIPDGTRFTGVGFGDVSATSGAALQTSSRARGVTEFNRPEDAHWDPDRPNDLYFVTTASFTGNSRLWRLRFDDASFPELGGRIDMLLGGTEGPKMMDNLTVSERGQILIQEDPGGQNHLAKVWLYDIDDETLTEIAQHDPVRFAPGGASFLTIDEESSGIIDVSDILGDGTFLLDVQAHYPLEPELVQGGQLLLMEVDKHFDKEKKGKKVGKGKCK